MINSARAAHNAAYAAARDAAYAPYNAAAAAARNAADAHAAAAYAAANDAADAADAAHDADPANGWIAMERWLDAHCQICGRETGAGEKYFDEELGREVAQTDHNDEVHAAFYSKNWAAKEEVANA
jgi:hypothetical protein